MEKHLAGLPSVIDHITIKDRIEKEGVHKKLSDAIIEMIVSFNLPYYGEFMQFINMYSAKIGTCGVNITEKGMNFYWDPEWIDKIDRKEVIFTIVHEVMHLLFDHVKRGVGYDKKIANLAADMIINSIIHGDLMVNEGLTHMVDIPKDEMGNNFCVFLPKEYTGNPIFEEVYDWMMNKYTKWQNENSDKIQNNKNKEVRVDKNGNARLQDKNKSDKGEGQGDGQGEKQQGDGDGQQGEQDGDGDKDGKGKKDKKSGYGPNGKSGDSGQNDVDMYPIEEMFENIENNKGQTFDVHFDDDVPEEVRKQWVESTMEKLKSRGLETGEIEKTLNKLRKSEKDYLKEIKRSLSNDIFGSKKVKSITKLHRRGIWGLKGHRKYKTKIAVLLDTSGSMCGEFEKVLSYVYRQDIEMEMIQCDTEIKNHVTIKNKKELEKMEISGLGGTTLTPGIQYVSEHKELKKLNLLILTDGYTDTLDFTGFKKNCLILTTGEKCPVVPGTTPSGGKLKQIIIEKQNKK